MQHQLFRQQFWTADVLRGLRPKIEQSGGQALHYGPAMAVVFRDLARGQRAEGTVGVTNQSSPHTERGQSAPGVLVWAQRSEGTVGVANRSNFYSEGDPSAPWITLTYQNITTAPAFRDVSQEVCAPRRLPTNPL